MEYMKSGLSVPKKPTAQQKMSRKLAMNIHQKWYTLNFTFNLYTKMYRRLL